MRFKKLKLFNIRSYKNQEVEFPEGSLLLSGDVGSGKSSILMAIEYALFGLQPGQKGNALLRNNAEHGGVTLEMEIHGTKAVIERKLKRTLKGVSNEYASIEINGVKNESSITEIKSKIISLLGYPPEFVKKNNVLYRYTVHTAQEQMKQIIFEDAETRVNILRHVFGIDKYRIIKSNLTTIITNLKGEARTLQGEISELEKDKENLELRKSGIKNLETRITSKKEELSKKTEERKLKETELKSLEKTIDEKRSLQQEIDKSKIMLSTKREFLSGLNAQEEELKKSLEENKETFDEQIYREILDKIQIKKEELEKTHTKSIDIMAQTSLYHQEREDILKKKERIFRIDICPTCLQDVSETHKHNILNETENRLSTIKKQLESLEIEKSQAKEKIKQNKNHLSGLEDNRMKMEILKFKQEQLERARKKLQEIDKQKLSITKDHEFLLRHITELKERLLAYSPLDTKYRKKESELRTLFQEEKQIEISLAELVRELELSHKEISLLQEAIKNKEFSKKKLKNTNELINWLSTQFLKLIDIAERNIFLKLRKEFSTLFRKWFQMLVSENSLDSQIDENFTPIILQGETEMDYSYLSGGERTAVALAYRLALNQTINSLMSKIRTKGIIILDEPTDGFSETQINKVRDILEELDTEQLIMVSHEQKIESFVDNVIRVTKEADTSSIEEVFTQKIES